MKVFLEGQPYLYELIGVFFADFQVDFGNAFLFGN
jgi:hypothetical protein